MKKHLYLQIRSFKKVSDMKPKLPTPQKRPDNKTKQNLCPSRVPTVLKLGTMRQRLALKIRSAKKFGSDMYGRHLWITNTFTCAGLLGVGDCMVQNMNIAVEAKKGRRIKYDFPRTGRMVLMGFVLGPFNHLWYKQLDLLFKGNRSKTVFKKIMSDQLVAGPFFATSFLIGMGLMEGKTPQEAHAEWKDKFISIYIVDWLFWPAAQFVNFRFVPGQFRVLYVSTATCLWNSLLSYMKHREENEDIKLVRWLVSGYKSVVDKATTGRRSD